MFAALRLHHSKTTATAAAVFFNIACGLSAQNFTSSSANLNPFGVNGPLPFGEVPDFGDGLALKGGFAYGVELSSTYDSNVLLSENDPESDMSLGVSPSVSYTSDPEGGASVVILANYEPSASASLSNSDYNSFDQTGNVSIIVAGSRTTLSAFAGVLQESGADSLVASQGFFTGTAYSLGLQGKYQLAPRTTVRAGWSTLITDYGESEGNSSSGSGSAEGVNESTVFVSGLWAATERLSFGPRLAYSEESSDIVEDFTTWELSMVGRYELTERIRLAASVGMQYSDYSEEGQSEGFSPSGSLNAIYQIDELWSWRSSIQSSLTPSPTDGSYAINGWSISTLLNRQLLVGSAGIGLNLDFSNFDRVGPTGSFSETQNAQQNLGLLMNYRRPLFMDRVDFITSFIFRQNFGDEEWSQIVLKAGLNMSF
ncbi:MAG: hypothetical protein ACRCXD_18320 [Luteolibacter sp.]